MNNKTTVIFLETKMTDLSTTMYQQMEDTEKLDLAIRKNLEALGYGK